MNFKENLVVSGSLTFLCTVSWSAGLLYEKVSAVCRETVPVGTGTKKDNWTEPINLMYTGIDGVVYLSNKICVGCKRLDQIFIDSI